MVKASSVMTSLAVATALAAPTFAAYNGCRVADVTGDGFVNEKDAYSMSEFRGQFDPRRDLDGNGIVGPEDMAMLKSFLGRQCNLLCPADLDRDGTVDATDHKIVFKSFGTNCRPDLDRDGFVEAGATSGHDTSDHDTEMLISYAGAPVHPQSAESRADFDRDSDVDDADLDLLLGARGEDCRSDLNKDGQVDVTDIWVLLGYWGTCL